LLTNALLLATRLELTVLVVVLEVELVSFWQETIKRQTNKMNAEKKRLIAMFWILKLIKRIK
jgi:hypothetical protein